MSENDCIFRKIVNGEMESEVVHDEEGVLAFMDVNGKAPVHVLVIPKEHVSSLEEVGKLSDGVVKCIFEVAQEVAEKMDVAGSGYAFRINNGRDANQEVFHLHAGRRWVWLRVQDQQRPRRESGGFSSTRARYGGRKMGMS